MNAKLLIFVALFAILVSALAFDKSNENSGGDNQKNLISSNGADWIQDKRRNKPCKSLPGCFQFMCNRCCGSCNAADCVTAMCMLCCG
uniref:Uncharacterized protein n=1 Tax=Panagrolaimus davidi TaxID=227884 RepID=A0A914P869_9BILA